MRVQVDEHFFDGFELAEDCLRTDPSLCGWEERLLAVKDISECNSQTSSVIDAFVEAVRAFVGSEAAFMSLIVKDRVLRQQNADLDNGGLCDGAPGFCLWTLVPEQAQALVIEDATLDARVSESKLVVRKPFIRSYVAAPLITSNRQRVGTLCVLGTKSRSFGLHHVALICNVAELIMRMLEGQVMQLRPGSSVLKGKHSRWPAAYIQAFAMVDMGKKGWPVLASTRAFDVMAGRESTSKEGDLCGLFQNPASVQEKMDKLHSAAEGARWQIDGLRPCGKTFDVAAVMMSASRELHLSDCTIGIPSRFSTTSVSPKEPASKPDSLYIVLLMPQSESSPQRPPKALPIPSLKLQAQLGEGSYARVYRGVYGKTRVAIKVVHDLGHEQLPDDEPAEVTFMRTVSHPNLLRLFEWALVENSKREQRLWLVMELCDGGCISDAIDQGYFRESLAPQAQLKTQTIAYTFKELASGLKALHDKDILHCDISGGNIMLQSSKAVPHGFTVKICDFGLARLSTRTSGSLYTGSYSYQAPEVLQSVRVSKASDAYSLGVILYEMLCGERAWSGYQPSQIYYTVVEGGQSPEWPDDVPQGLKGVAQRLLEYKAEDCCTLELALDLVQDFL